MSTIIIIPVVSAAAALIAAWLTRQFCDPGSIAYMADHPNHRSLHDQPVPRAGGLAILIAIITCGAAVAVLYPEPALSFIAPGVLVVALVSFLDDRYSVTPLYRLIAHVAAAMVVIYGGLSLQEFEVPGAVWYWSPVAGYVFSALFIVWMINLYNFMDGMDGFAGGMAVSGFGAFAAMGWMAGHDLFLVVSLIIACASAGFLVFNFPPARIFMGDVGSSTLGLLAGSLSLWGARDGIFPFWIAVLVFSPFITDATVTLLRRLWRREKIWQAHKTHYYQQLVRAGWGHRKTVLVQYLVMLGCGITAVLCLRAAVATQVFMLAGWTFFYIIFFFWVSRYAPGRYRDSA